MKGDFFMSERKKNNIGNKNSKEYLKSYSVSVYSQRVKLTVVLPAGSVTNINPSLLADEIQKRAGDISYSLIRKQLLTENMELFV